MITKLFSEIDAAIIVNSYNSIKNSFNLITAHSSDHLDKTLEKVWRAISFINDYTDGGFTKLSQVVNSAYKRRASRYETIGGVKIETGWMSQITGIVADKPSKIRGDRVDLLVYEESGCHVAGTEVLMYDGSFKKVEDIELGDVLMGDDGTPRNVIELHTGTDQMYKIIPNIGDPQIVNSNHIIYGKYRDYSKKTYESFEIKAKDYYEMIKLYPRRKDNYKLITTDKISFPHKDVILDPYFLGLWLGDGHADAPSITSKDSEVLEYLEQFAKSLNMYVTKRECTNSKDCYRIRLNSYDNKNFIMEQLRELNVLNNKHIPLDYIHNSRDVLLNLLAGLIDSDGSYHEKKHCIEITQSDDKKHIIEQAALICRILGMRISLSSRKSKTRMLHGRQIKGDVVQHRLRILYGHSEIPTKIKRKQTSERNLKYKSSHDRLATTFKIEKVQVDKFYGFSLDGNQLFVLKDFTVCHNSWPGLIKAFIQSNALVGQPGSQWGYRIGGGKYPDTCR